MLIRKHIQSNFYIVFIFQSIGQDFELEASYYTYNNFLHTGIVFLENLNGTLLRNLGYAL